MMIDPVTAAAFWLLVLQGTGASSSQPAVFPRFYKSEQACITDALHLKKQMYVEYVCMPPQEVQHP